MHRVELKGGLYWELFMPSCLFLMHRVELKAAMVEMACVMSRIESS